MIRHFKKMVGFNSSRYRLHHEMKEFANTVPENALVLDAGAGTGPYRHLFQHARYESADFEKVYKAYQTSTYVCDLRRIPVEDSRFDFIIFNQVMEHLPEPKSVLTELYRVLKPGGILFYTGPLFYEEHEVPYDFYRYTQFGLRYLFEETGYTINRIDWLEGYYGTIGYQLRTMSKCLPYRISDDIYAYPFIPLMAALKVGFFITSIFFHQMEARIKYMGNGHPKNYLAMAMKRSISSN